jgi:hypothetical protein
MTSLESVLRAQRAWAVTREIGLTGDSTNELDANLFQAWSPATRREFEAGDGAELGSGATPGKMQSLRSSSALAVNFFDYWRYRSISALAAALGLAGTFSELAFEYKVPTGLRGKSPNLDVLLCPVTGAPVGVESKFCEPFDLTRDRPPLEIAYFPASRPLWAAHGLTSTQSLAESVGQSARFTFLDVNQLLKHILGLAHTFGERGAPRLLYLWYDDGSADSRQHAQETADFSAAVSGECEFLHLSYQEAFNRVRSLPAAGREYVHYLAERYFAA